MVSTLKAEINVENEPISTIKMFAAPMPPALVVFFFYLHIK